MNSHVPGLSNKYNPRVIVALDYNNEKEVMDLVALLDPSLCKLKVGKELFAACGSEIVKKLVSLGFDVFLDLKFHDIPNTVYKACKVVCDLGIWMLNVHVSGGAKMLDLAKKAIDETKSHVYLVGVTVLTSLKQEDLYEIGFNDTVDNYALKLSNLAFQCGLDGVVCSALESPIIKSKISINFLTVTPGIRIMNEVSNDQARIVTPEQAIKNQVDYIVVGRPITQSEDPYKAIIDINTKIGDL